METKRHFSLVFPQAAKLLTMKTESMTSGRRSVITTTFPKTCQMVAFVSVLRAATTSQRGQKPLSNLILVTFSKSANVAASGSQFSRPLGIGCVWNGKMWRLSLY